MGEILKMKEIITDLLNGEQLETKFEAFPQFKKQALSAERITEQHKKQPTFDKSVMPEKGNHTLEFIKMPTDLRYYAYMSEYGVNDSVLMLYQLIIDFYNVDQRKAFPSQYRLAMQTGKSLRTIINNLKVLRQVGLIQIKKTGSGSNNEYRPLLPLPPAQLFERYPKALERLIKQNKSVVAIRQRDEKRRKRKVETAEWQ